MSRARCWRLLGIAPTTDTTEIRRAYARALKALDVDRDPHAFIALREARETALAHAAADTCEEPTDIDRALTGSFDDRLSAATIRARNIALYDLLATNWRVARDQGHDLPTFTRNIRLVLLDRANGSLSRAPYELLVEHTRLELLKAAAARKRGPTACHVLFSGDLALGRAELQPDITRRERALIIDLLLTTDARAPLPRPNREIGFAIPGPIVEQAAAAADLPVERLGRALRADPDPIDHCRARIALLGTTLALPQTQAEPLLRAMHGG